MLQSLDTLISFVVIMAIVSLFVTILVQMVSAALSLRGKNLANALALTFQTIDPALAASAHQLAAKILSDPLLSDPIVPDKDRGKYDAPTQMGPWSAFPRNWLKACKLANAIRPEEVYRALKKLAAGSESKSSATSTAEAELAQLQKALSALSTADDKTSALKAVADAETRLACCKKADSSKFDADLVAKQDKVKAAQKKVEHSADKDADAKKTAREELKSAQKELEDFCATSLPDIARKFLSGLGSPADKASAAADKLSAFKQLAGVVPDNLKSQFDKALQDTGAQLVRIIDTEQQKFEDWFNSAQDRAQQWFQLHTRVVAISASILIAFLFQLDAVEVFHYVSTNSTGRAALVAGADKVIQQADGVLKDEKGGLLNRIANEVAKVKPALTLADLSGIIHTGELETALLEKGDKSNPQISAAEVQKIFNDAVKKTTKAYYEEKSGLLADLSKDVGATGFELFPAGFWRWPAWKTESEGKRASIDVCQSLKNVVPHIFGILLFAALLTLGAPYWYNLLKNLTSLRPALAQLTDKEDIAQTETKKLNPL
jgi:hypothetical protein